MSTLTNVKPISAYQTCFRVHVLGEDIATGITSLFSIRAAIPDKSLTMNLMNVKSKDKNTNPIYLCDGEFAADTSSEAMVETYDFSLTLNQDFNTIINDLAPEVCKDIWLAMLNGDTFKDGNGNQFIVIGVNGQRWINSGASQTDLDTRYISYRDSLLKHPARKNTDGTPYLEANGKSAPFKDRPLHMFELMSGYSATEKTGYRIAHCLNTGSTFNQDTTANNNSIDEKRLFDVFDIEQYLVEGISDPQLINGVAETTVYRVGRASNGVTTGRVFFAEGSSPAAITACTNGIAGDIIIVTDTDDMTTTGYVVSDATTTAVINANITFGEGCQIFSDYDLTAGATPDLTADATEKYGMVTVATAGVPDAFVVTDWFTNTGGTGATTGKCDFMDWEYSTSTFTSFLGE